MIDFYCVIGLIGMFLFGMMAGHMLGKRGGAIEIVSILKTASKEEIEDLLSEKPPRRIWGRIFG